MKEQMYSPIWLRFDFLSDHAVLQVFDWRIGVYGAESVDESRGERAFFCHPELSHSDIIFSAKRPC